MLEPKWLRKIQLKVFVDRNTGTETQTRKTRPENLRKTTNENKTDRNSKGPSPTKPVFCIKARDVLHLSVAKRTVRTETTRDHSQKAEKNPNPPTTWVENVSH